MFRKRTRIALCLIGSCLTSTNVLLVAQTAGVAHEAAPSSDRPKKPGLLDQFLQTVVNHASANPTLKMNVLSSAPVTGQPVGVEAKWTQSVTNPSYKFNWGDGGIPELQVPSPAQQHVYVKPGRFVASVQGTATFDGRLVTSVTRVLIDVSLAPEIVSQPSTVVPHPALPPITAGVPPTALKLFASPGSVVQGQPIDFRVAVDPPAKLNNFHYYFGDGSDTVAANGTQYTYPRSGTFQAYVTAESNPAEVPLTSATVSISIRPATGRPVLTLVASTTTPLVGKELGVSAALNPAEVPVSYRFDWGDGSPIDISDADAPGDGHHTYSSSGAYLVRVTAYIVRDGRPVTITSKPLPLNVAAPPSHAFTALILAGLATLTGLGCFAFWPRVTCVYGSTRWDSPRISGAGPNHLAVSFRPDERPAQHSIRTLK